MTLIEAEFWKGVMAAGVTLAGLILGFILIWRSQRPGR